MPVQFYPEGMLGTNRDDEVIALARESSLFQIRSFAGRAAIRVHFPNAPVYLAIC
jgi:hypothetical protein